MTKKKERVLKKINQNTLLIYLIGSFFYKKSNHFIKP